MPSLININTAAANQLTQLPGIAKNLACRIVSHRNRHGYFTHWEEMLAVKEFPAGSLDEIKNRATIDPPRGILREEFGPRRVHPRHRAKAAKKPRGPIQAVRATRSPDRMKPAA